MSRLTEIMKQIPLEELTGDAEMNESKMTERNISVKQGAMVKRRTGALVTAAACAAAVGAGAFVYSRSSKPSAAEQPELISQAETVTDSEPFVYKDHTAEYQRNLSAYKDYYSRRSVDYHAVQDGVFPLAADTPEMDIGDGMKIRLIGYRAVSTFFIVDLEVCSESELSEFSLDRAECQNVRLTKEDGSFIEGHLKDTMCKGGGKSGLVSFIFPQYVCKDDTVVSVNDNEPVTFSAGKLGFMTAADHDGGEETYRPAENYSAQFTPKQTGCYDYSIDADTQVAVPALLAELDRNDILNIKQINYSNVGATVVFTVEGADEEYCRKVIDQLNDPAYYPISRELEFLGCPMSGDDQLDYMFAGLSCEYSVMYDYSKLDDELQLWASREYFDQPIDADSVTGFMIGGTVIEAPGTAENAESEAEKPAGVLSLDDVDINITGSVRSAENTAAVSVELGGLPEGLEPDLAQTVTIEETTGQVNGVISLTGRQTALSYADGVYTSELTFPLEGIDHSGDIRLTMYIEDLKDKDGGLIAKGGAKLYFAVAGDEQAESGLQ